MNLQALQGRLAVASQTLQNIGHNIATTIKGMVVSAGQAFKQLGNIIAQPFAALQKALTSRSVEPQSPLDRRSANDQEVHNRGRSNSLESLLEGMSEIDVELNSEFDHEDLSVPPQPKDTLDFHDPITTESKGTEHSFTIEDISQEPQNGVLHVGIEDISQTPQHGVLMGHVEDVSQTPQHGVLMGHIEDISQQPQHGVLIEDISFRPQRGILESSMPTPQRATFDPVSSSFAGHLDKLKERGMVSGETAIKDSGLVGSHVDKFKEVAKETKTILMFRAVNPMSTGLLEEGTSAKGLNVHGKSSDWGPMAGYIAFDQALSKKHSDVKSITKGNEDNAHSIEKHGDHDSPIEAKQLSLSPSRLDYLKKEGLIAPSNEHGEPLSEPSTDSTQYFINSGKGGNDRYMFRLDKGENGSFSVSYKSLKDPVAGNKVNDWSELKVMGDKATAKPLTADYDMFAMLPKVGDGTLAGKTLDRDPKLTELREKRSDLKEKLKTASGEEAIKLKSELKTTSREIIRTAINSGRNKLLGQDERAKVDPELGRLTQWQGDIRTKLNESVKGPTGYTGGDLVKHGTEQDNTQFSEKDEKVFVIMPNGDTFMTQNWEQTQAFMWSAKQDDFLTYTNRSYVSNNPTLSPTREQTVFYPGQVPQFRNNEDKTAVIPNGGTQHLDFDMQQAAIKFGLTDK